MILNRKHFSKYFNDIKPGLGNPDSPLWCPEEVIGPCQHFVCVAPIATMREAHEITKDIYWEWCNANLNGQLCCYCSDYVNKQEWWGFTDEKDIVLWTLKWT
jgi:hypothetical protein